MFSVRRVKPDPDDPGREEGRGRLEADPGTPFTLEAATKLSAPNLWSPLVTTNISTMPFDYVDFDVKLSEKPHKFYRVRQPKPPD